MKVEYIPYQTATIENGKWNPFKVTVVVPDKMGIEEQERLKTLVVKNYPMNNEFQNNSIIHVESHGHGEPHLHYYLEENKEHWIELNNSPVSVSDIWEHAWIATAPHSQFKEKGE